MDRETSTRKRGIRIEVEDDTKRTRLSDISNDDNEERDTYKKRIVGGEEGSQKKEVVEEEKRKEDRLARHLVMERLAHEREEKRRAPKIWIPGASSSLSSSSSSVSTFSSCDLSSLVLDIKGARRLLAEEREKCKKTRKRVNAPTLLERQIQSHGRAVIVAGADEVGRGPLAGPVVVAVVTVGDGFVPVPDVRDSKCFPSGAAGIRERRLIADRLRRAPSHYCSVSRREANVIDMEGINRAIDLSLVDAVYALPSHAWPHYLLIDGDRPIPHEFLNTGEGDVGEVEYTNSCDTGEVALLSSRRQQQGPPFVTCVVPQADSFSYVVAAASIIAKDIHDRLMMEWDTLYPMYGFQRHVGYGTKEHQEALTKYGFVPGLHRRMFGECERKYRQANIDRLKQSRSASSSSSPLPLPLPLRGTAIITTTTIATTTPTSVPLNSVKKKPKSDTASSSSTVLKKKGRPSPPSKTCPLPPCAEPDVEPF